MFEWCIAELRWKASIYHDSGLVRVYQADVVKSDIAIPQTLNQALSAAVKDLERVSIAIIISSSTIVSRLVYLCELFPLNYSDLAGRARKTRGFPSSCLFHVKFPLI